MMTVPDRAPHGLLPPDPEQPMIVSTGSNNNNPNFPPMARH
jgi:hypothetical protein